ncbi:MAG: TerC family protein [Pseudomonadota bacterium]
MVAWIWAAFIIVILCLLALDLGVFHRKDRAVSTREAIGWTLLWVGLALAFTMLVYFMYEGHWLGIGKTTFPALTGKQAALKFLTGYLIEKSLSLDNIAVIAMIFAYFAVPLKYQHRVLFWGILGAIVMRGVMIGAGITLVRRFDWIVYVFGAFLLFTAFRMMHPGGHGPKFKDSRVLRLARRFFLVTEEISRNRFFVRVDGKRAATPLLLVLLMVESSDVVFAVDSIPAILAVTIDPFLVFTSNIFAILGLRSLYFALANMLDRFRYLRVSLVVILAYVGIKLLLSRHVHVPAAVSLAVIGLSLAAGVAGSLIAAGMKKRDNGRKHKEPRR